MDAPLSKDGESMRQKGPIKLAVVSVWPLLPLLSKHTKADTPKEPAANTTSLCDSVVACPSLAM